jgi:hypothetical protein
VFLYLQTIGLQVTTQGKDLLQNAGFVLDLQPVAEFETDPSHLAVRTVLRRETVIDIPGIDRIFAGITRESLRRDRFAFSTFWQNAGNTPVRHTQDTGTTRADRAHSTGRKGQRRPAGYPVTHFRRQAVFGRGGCRYSRRDLL